MKYILIFSLVSATLSIHSGECSNMKKSIKDAEIEDGIIEKAQKENADVSSLTEDEKEWIYKTDLLQHFEAIKDEYKRSVDFADYEDLSNTAAKIAQFELNKGYIKTAHKWLTETGRWFLEAALRGSGNHLAFLSSLADDGQLDKAILKKIEDEAPDEDSSPETYSDLIKDDFVQKKEFTRLRDIIAKALEDCGEETDTSTPLKKRKLYISDRVIDYIFQEDYKKQKHGE